MEARGRALTLDVLEEEKELEPEVFESVGVQIYEVKKEVTEEEEEIGEEEGKDKMEEEDEMVEEEGEAEELRQDKELEEEVEAVKVVEEEVTEVLINRSSVEPLTFRNKMGIFIGVLMIVLTTSGQSSGPAGLSSVECSGQCAVASV